MKKKKFHPTVGITMGDPAGIGPEISLSALSNSSIYKICSPFIVGDTNILRKAKKFLKKSLPVYPISDPSLGVYDGTCINVMNLSNINPETTEWGKPTARSAVAMVRFIKTSVEMAKNRKIDAIVTCPIHKKALHMAKVHHPGHTELIAELTNTTDFIMMMVGTRLKVSLVTIHIPITSVPKDISIEKVSKTIHLTSEGLKNRFGIKKPIIAVAGLNPHAGENGKFGTEEINIIQPAVMQSARRGIHVEGPFPPDTVFYHALQGKYDAVICMYHDQGLIPFKLIHFKDGVNVTLGIPIIRTSVDHGTAYDIAGTGKADPGSLIAAIRLAARLAEYTHLSHATRRQREKNP
jgi:4-hydroxythreonine-4-phosphate dehydrogenase